MTRPTTPTPPAAVLRAGRTKKGGAYATFMVGTRRGPVTFRSFVSPEEVAKIRSNIQGLVRKGASAAMAKKATLSGIGADKFDPEGVMAPDFSRKPRPTGRQPFDPDAPMTPDFSRKKKRRFSLFHFSDPDAVMEPGWREKGAKTPADTETLRPDFGRKIKRTGTSETLTPAAMRGIEGHVNDAVIGLALSGLRKAVPAKLHPAMAGAAKSAVAGFGTARTRFVDDEDHDYLDELSSWGARGKQAGFERAGYVVTKPSAGIRVDNPFPGAGLNTNLPDPEDLAYVDDVVEAARKKKPGVGSWGRYNIMGAAPKQYNEKRLLVAKAWKKLYRRYRRLIARAWEKEIFDEKVQKKAYDLAKRDFKEAGIPLQKIRITAEGEARLAGEDAPASEPDSVEEPKVPEDIYEDAPASDLLPVDPRQASDPYNVDAWLDDDDIEDKEINKLVEDEEKLEDEDNPWLLDSIMGGSGPDKRWKYPMSWFETKVGKLLQSRDVPNIIRILAEEGIAEAGAKAEKDLPGAVSPGSGKGGGGGGPAGGGGGGGPEGGAPEGAEGAKGGPEEAAEEAAEGAPEGAESAAAAEPAATAAEAVQGIVEGLLK